MLGATVGAAMNAEALANFRRHSALFCKSSLSWVNNYGLQTAGGGSTIVCPYIDDNSSARTAITTLNVHIY